jgi:hypothetical protein
VSVKVMTAVWPLQLPALDKLALLALADNANDEGECYPSISTLLDKCGMSRRALIYALQRLEQWGHLSRRRTEGKKTVYAVHPCTSCTSAGDAPVHKVHTTSAPGASPSPLINPSPSGNRHEPSVRRRGKRAEEPKNPPDEPPPSNLNVEAWHRWEQYRREIRKPIHPASWLSAQRKLAAFGADQGAVVEQSIADGYQGLFPLKQQPKGKEKSEWL